MRQHAATRRKVRGAVLLDPDAHDASAKVQLRRALPAHALEAWLRDRGRHAVEAVQRNVDRLAKRLLPPRREAAQRRERPDRRGPAADLQREAVLPVEESRELHVERQRRRRLQVDLGCLGGCELQILVERDRPARSARRARSGPRPAAASSLAPPCAALPPRFFSAELRARSPRPRALAMPAGAPVWTTPPPSPS